MSDNTLKKALLIMICDCPGGDNCAHGFRSTASILLNEESAFDGDGMEAPPPTARRRKRRRRDEMVQRLLGNDSRSIVRKGVCSRI